MSPETRAGLLEDLGAHVEHRAPGLLSGPPNPSACVVLLAIELGCCALVLGDVSIPHIGVRSVGVEP